MNEVWKKPPISLEAYKKMVGHEVGVPRDVERRAAVLDRGRDAAGGGRGQRAHRRRGCIGRDDGHGPGRGVVADLEAQRQHVTVTCERHGQHRGATVRDDDGTGLGVLGAVGQGLVYRGGDYFPA